MSNREQAANEDSQYYDGDFPDDEALDTFGFSFVDMVSGGFGAAFFLFLIFATLPIDVGQPSGGGEQYIRIWLSWEDREQAGQSFEPILEFQHELGAPWQDYRLSSGVLEQDKRNIELSYQGREEQRVWSQLFGAGFSNARAPALNAISDSGERRNAIWLHLADPCPGIYRVRVNRNAGFGDMLTSVTALNAEVKYQIRLETPGLTPRLFDGTYTPGVGERAPLVMFAQNQSTFEVAAQRRSDDLAHCR